MIREGIKQYPNEACGLIIAAGKRYLVEVCRNMATAPGQQFLIDTNDYLIAVAKGELIGVWHTHPDTSAEPTCADLAGVEVTGVPWFIISVSKRDDMFVIDGPTVTEPKGIPASYIERPYILGTFDCYSIVRDFYEREFGIKLGDYPRVLADGTPGNVVFQDTFEKEGFTVVSDEPQRGDCFLIRQGKTEIPTHVAVYVGGDTILHHCINRLSRMDIFSGYWRDHTAVQVRRSLKC